MNARARCLVALACIAALLGAARPASGGGAAGENDGRHVLVRFRDGTTSEDARHAHADAGGRVVRAIGTPRILVVRVPSGVRVDETARRYRRHRAVRYAEPNAILRATVMPNDPWFPGNSASTDLWALHNVGQNGGTRDVDVDAPEGWDIAGLSGSPWPTGGVTVGVIDTGVDGAHPDLAGKVIGGCSRATSGGGALSPGCPDDNGHGSHVAGTIGATGNNATGVVGVAPTARIFACKSLDASGAGTSADFIACLGDMVAKRAQHDIRVVNASLGSPFFSQAEQDAVANLVGAGIVFVAAAGNRGNSVVDYPAGYQSAVAVGAIGRNGTRASFSQFNSTIDLAAPGVDIVSTSQGGYRIGSGTSQAAPHVSGVAALASQVTGKTGSALRSALETTAGDLGASGRDDQYGHGLVNLCRALGGACGADPGPPPTPTPPTPTPQDSPTPGPEFGPTFSSDTPCGDAVAASVLGATVEAPVSASASAGRTVTLSATGLPAYASFTSTPGNPATGTLVLNPRLIDAIASILGGGQGATLTASTPTAEATCGVTLFATVV